MSVSVQKGLTHKYYREWTELPVLAPRLPNPRLSWHLAAPKALCSRDLVHRSQRRFQVGNLLWERNEDYAAELSS